MKIKKNLKLLLSISLIALTVAVDNNLIYSATKDSNSTVIYINSNNLNKVNKAFSSNIKTVANIVENNTKKYQAFLIGKKYWANSEEHKDSIEILKKMFTLVYERGEEACYYQNLVKPFVEDISTLLKDDKNQNTMFEKPWTETKTGKSILELLMGLVSFRTFYNVKTGTDIKSVDEIFNEVFNEVKKDYYYQKLIERFNGGGKELEKIIKRNWNCYFNQFCILNNGKFEDKKLKSVVE